MTLLTFCVVSLFCLFRMYTAESTASSATLLRLSAFTSTFTISAGLWSLNGLISICTDIVQSGNPKMLFTKEEKVYEDFEVYDSCTVFQVKVFTE